MESGFLAAIFMMSGVGLIIVAVYNGEAFNADNNFKEFDGKIFFICSSIFEIGIGSHFGKLRCLLRRTYLTFETRNYKREQFFFFFFFFLGYGYF